MASDVMNDEEFRAHMKRMVTCMQNNEQLDADRCPCCGRDLTIPEEVYPRWDKRHPDYDEGD